MDEVKILELFVNDDGFVQLMIGDENIDKCRTGRILPEKYFHVVRDLINMSPGDLESDITIANVKARFQKGINKLEEFKHKRKGR